MAYSYFGCCENHKFNLLHSISSSLRNIVQASLAFHSSVQPKYVVDNLVMCENRVNTHSYRAYFTENILNVKTLANREKKKFLISQVLQTVSSDLYMQWCSAPPCGGPRNIASYYGVTSQHSPCHVGNAVFSLKSN